MPVVSVCSPTSACRDDLRFSSSAIRRRSIKTVSPCPAWRRSRCSRVAMSGGASPDVSPVKRRPGHSATSIKGNMAVIGRNFAILESGRVALEWVYRLAGMGDHPYRVSPPGWQQSHGVHPVGVVVYDQAGWIAPHPGTPCRSSKTAGHQTMKSIPPALRVVLDEGIQRRPAMSSRV